MSIRLQICLFLYLLLLVHQIQSQHSDSEIVKQKSIRDKINYSITAFQIVHCFLSTKQQFVVDALHYSNNFDKIDEKEIVQMRLIVHVYWKNNNLHTLPKQEPKEKVRLLIYSGKEKVIEDSEFYYTWGTLIQHKMSNNKSQGTKYRIILISTGEKIKFIELKLQKPKLSIFSLNKKMSVQRFSKISDMLSKLKSQLILLEMQSQGMLSLLADQNQYQILQNFELYFKYLMGESLLVIGLVWLQVWGVKKIIQKQELVV